MARIRRISEMPDDFDLLVHESIGEEFSFLHKMKNEWHSGENLFSKDGEIVLGAFHGDSLVGICGVNIDPYIDDQQIGRLRHLYVSPPYRRTGLGAKLVNQCLEHGLGRFNSIRLRAANSATDRFYRSIGFQKTSEKSASHIVFAAQASV